MDISKALVIVLLICIVPVERGNMLKNDVTPAPPVDLSELIGKRDEQYEPPVIVVTADEIGDNLLKDAIVVTDTVKVVTENKPAVRKITLARRKRKIKQPVCHYNIAEIFKFGNLQSPTVSKCVDTEFTIKSNIKLNLTSDSELNDEDASTKDATDKNETTKLDREEEDMKLEVDSMQSFEEWKNIKLQEQESRKAEEEPTQPLPIIRAKKTKVNYASQDCGAKVLANNKEAKHVSAILDENRDLYMLNPCSENIWFVIELCEPVQVQQLQIGNLELFSSAPKEFIVSVSERYPAREWHSLGPFHATNERILQTFVPKTEGNMFAKYIKFEMVSHFSNEHFCPMTLVRVLGVSMVDELDASENLSTKDDEAQTELLSEEDNKNRGGPIDAVYNMVKNAVDHVLNNGGDSSSDDNLSDTKVNKTEGALDNNDTETIDPLVESEVVLVTNDTEIANPNGKDIPDFITLVETGHGEDISEYLKNFSATCPRKIPLYMPKFISFMKPISQKLNANMCWILEFFCKVSLAGCLVHYPYSYSQVGLFVTISAFKNESLLVGFKNSSFHTTKLPDNITSGVGKHVKETENIVVGSVITQQTGQVENDNNLETSKQHSVDDQQGKLAVNGGLDKDAMNTSDITDSTTLTNSDTPEITSEDSVADNLLLQNKPDTKKDTLGSEIKQDQNKLPENMDKHTDVIKDETRNEDKIVIVDTLAQENPSASNETPDNKKENIEADQTVDATEASTQKNHKQDHNNNSPEIQTSNQHPNFVTVTNQKDSVFMRLSNRIRSLEKNLSLSSDYLETLSQRYKRQMDEMQRAFNQTTSKLMSTSRTANENDARQTELIQHAQAEIEMLTQQLRNLSLTHDQLNIQLVERHLCLIVLEVLIFFAVLVTCIGRRMAQMRNDVQRAETMIIELENLLTKSNLGSKDMRSKPNGHCASISFQASNGHLSPCSDLIKPAKKHKTRQKVLSEINKNALNFTSNGGPVGVENVGNKSDWDGAKKQCASTARTKTQNWNGHPIALKIPNGHAKGRK